MPTTTTKRFQPLHPRTSLHKLRTAFRSSPPPDPVHSPMQSNFSASSSLSPLSAGTATTRLSGSSFGNVSTFSLGSALHSRARRIIRRKKSVVELEQEYERSLVGEDILSLVEPRPSVGAAYGGIEEVLAGTV